ncbi:MAG: UDP-N-acetylmuramoyl-L-alanyl-D-glutamate--2,6-diaminopimelate ligase [Spirochaetes bacterium]|nr:MAG: UDP-N-acetylmuramoyl-L-alanyl-D-glutamate--2,6-diaminopimelate ligase [Spirochaetota bacterium]
MTGKNQIAPVDLDALLERCGGMVLRADCGADRIISSIEYNSSKVQPGSLFAAIQGFQSDGHAYVEDAIGRGAAAVLVSASRATEFARTGGRGVALLLAENTRAGLSRLSAAFCGFPARGLTVIGITGTNGKTSITYMLESICREAGRVPGVIGTVDYRWRGKSVAAPNTTPESKDLQELIRAMAGDGVDTVVMEVSSHALKLNRADDIEPNVAVFTNLTRDHMDFHPDFEDYFEAKKRLFALVQACGKERKAGVVNADDEYGARILSGSGAYTYPVHALSARGEAAYAVEPGSIVNTIEGVRYALARPVKGAEIRLRVPGTFQVYNSLCALGAAHALGLPWDAIVRGLEKVESIPGRFDCVRSGMGFSAIVDYAHTGDALEKLLESARELAAGRLITVFGCGGDRDRTKRPLMGDIASRLSDRVIVTSDNPRTEVPDAIIRDILAGITGKNFEIEPDREKAIREAIFMARPGDLVVIAGKGHEDYQITGTVKRHFDDREIARAFMREREAG